MLIQMKITLTLLLSIFYFLLIAQTPPPNDCTPEVILAGGSITNNNNCFATYSNDAGNCPAGNQEATVWYEYRPRTTSKFVKINFVPGTISGPVSVEAFTGSTGQDCSGNFIPSGEPYCINAAPYEIDIKCFNATQQSIYVKIGSYSSNCGDFNLIFTEPQTCAGPDICSEINDIMFPASDGAAICISSCNNGNCSEPGDCNPDGASTWFAFKTDSVASVAIINISAPFLPMTTVYFGPTCNNFTEMLSCGVGTNTFAVQTNTMYYVKVESSNGQDLGNFDVCVILLRAAYPCYPGSNITSVTRPQNPNSNQMGPYCPGETVNFCIHIDFAVSAAAPPDGNNCQWIQGIIPSLGYAWDYVGSNLDAQGPGGNWFWLDQDNVDYNIPSSIYTLSTHPDGIKYLEYLASSTGMNAGTLLPGGWWVTSNGSGATCMNNGDPDNMWGDPFSCSGNQIYDFCFDLKVKDAEELENCTIKDLDFYLTVMADGETGCWSQASCAYSPPIGFDATLECGNSITLSGNNIEICNDSDANINVTASASGKVIRVITVNNPNVVGESYVGSPALFSNSVASFTDHLTSTSGEDEIVEYQFSVQGDDEGCYFNPFSVFVTVSNGAEISLNDYEIALDSCLNIIPNVDSTVVEYLWSTGETTNNITVCPSENATYTVTVTDVLGCTATSSTDVNLVGTRFYLSGFCFTDANFNSIFDPNQDFPLHNVAIEVLNDATIYFTDNDGFYNIRVDSGFNEVKFVIHFGEWMQDTIIRNINVINPQNYSFVGFKPVNTSSPSCITALTTTIQQCSTFAELNPQVFNTHSNLLEGYMIVHYDPKTYFAEMNPLPSGGQDNYFIWAFNDLAPSQTFAPKIKYWVPDTANPDDSLHFSIDVTDNINGDTLSSYSIAEIINCGTGTTFNKNRSWPDRAGDDNPTLRGEDITYKINFSNESLLTSSKVIISNAIDQHLDITSLKIQKSSHAFEVYYENNNLVFVADSVTIGNANQTNSNTGFITFTLEQKPNLADGTKIYHSANIDFNNGSAVSTASVVNTIVSYLPCQNTNAVIIQTGNSLNVSVIGNTYKWLDCNSGNLVSTNSQFLPDNNGLYQCEILIDDCLTITPCFDFFMVDTDEQHDAPISFVPNPANKSIEIKCEGNHTAFTRIFDINSKEVLRSNQKLIDIENLSNGIYIIEINVNKSGIIRRFIKM